MQRHTCVGCAHIHSPAGLAKVRGLHTEAHLCGVYIHTQPSGAHQGTGSAQTGTPAWGVHTQTATQGSPGHRVCAHRYNCVGCAYTATQGSPGHRICAHRYTCVGCAYTDSHAGLTRARGQHTQVHLCGVCIHRQPCRAHQGAGSVHTGTPAWGVHTHTHTAMRGSPGHRVCAHRHTCVGCTHTHTHTATQGSPGRRVCAHRHTCLGYTYTHTHSHAGLTRAQCLGCPHTHTHSHAGLTRAQGLCTQAHLRGVYMCTQPHGAHQGTAAVLCSLCGWRGLSGQGRGPSSGQTWEQTAQCLVFQPKEFGLCEQLLRKGFSSGNSLILLPPVHPCQRVSPLLFP